MELSEQQSYVLQSILNWYSMTKDSPSERPAILTGAAGTGKTTLVVELLRRLSTVEGLDVAVVTYTGKASDVLQAKLVSQGINFCYVGTIHSLFFVPKDIETREDGTEELIFEKKNRTAMINRGAWDLLIIDELSMIDSDMLWELQRLQVPLLFCGDHNQLKPVSGDTASLLSKPSFTLKEVHRQAIDNPIVQIATKILNDEDIPMGVLGEKFIRVYNNPGSVVPMVNNFMDKYFVSKLGSGVILCGENRVRHMFNNRVREKLGLSKSKYPQVGEQVICLKNDKNTGLKNGTLCEVIEACEPLGKDSQYGRMQVLNKQTLWEGSVTCYLGAFSKNMDFKAFQRHPEAQFFDYGYALTVHKAQGSEWDTVMLFNRRMPKQSPEDYKRWLYTGVTRASDKLIMIG